MKANLLFWEIVSKEAIIQLRLKNQYCPDWALCELLLEKRYKVSTAVQLIVQL